MKISLIIPSYQRPDSLLVCLGSAQSQSRAFNEIIVALRDSDLKSRDALGKVSGVRIVLVHEPGVLAAMSAALRTSVGDIVAFTDDDAILSPTHAETLEREFSSDRRLSGFGGRDCIFDNGVPRVTSLTFDVGRRTIYGRIIGNHHRGAGAIREVSSLKGVNAAYRRSTFALPRGLMGEGAQPHFEIAIATRIADIGGVLKYDPHFTVEHHVALRTSGAMRSATTPRDVEISAFNLQRSLARGYQFRRMLYVLLVGDRESPGISRVLLALFRLERSVVTSMIPAWRGTWRALRVSSEPLQFETF